MSDRNDALEEAAKLAAGNTVLEGRYRQWPWWGPGMPPADSDLVQFADSLAAQIRALKREPSPPSGPSPAEGARFFLPLTLKPIDPSIPFDDGDRVIVDAEGAQVGMISNPKLAAASIAAINASPQPARACALGEECRCLTEHIWDCPNWLAKQPQPSPAAPDVAGLVRDIGAAMLYRPRTVFVAETLQACRDTISAQAAEIERWKVARDNSEEHFRRYIEMIKPKLDAQAAALAAKEAECERLKATAHGFVDEIAAEEKEWRGAHYLNCKRIAELEAALRRIAQLPDENWAGDVARSALAGKEPAR